MNGRLLLAADLIYKNWDDTDFFGAIYEDQWALSFGSQYRLNQRIRLRIGYAYNEDPTRDTVPGDIGGIPLGDIPTVQYIQGEFAAITQHRLAGGIGICDFLQGVDLDASLGGVFGEEKTFGATTASVESWFFAFGLTWRFGKSCPESCCPSSYEMPIEPSTNCCSRQSNCCSPNCCSPATLIHTTCRLDRSRYGAATPAAQVPMNN